MPGITIGKTLGHGFAGNYAQTPDAIIVARPNQDTAPIAFGTPVQAGTKLGVTNALATLTAANFIGIAVTEVNSATTYPDTEAGGYLPRKAVSVIQRGNVTVICANGDPANGGAVYIALTDNAYSGATVGAFFAGTPNGAADTDYILLPNAQWANDADTNGVADICLLNRVHA
jgi:hypothetical protein